MLIRQYFRRMPCTVIMQYGTYYILVMNWKFINIYFTPEPRGAGHLPAVVEVPSSTTAGGRENPKGFSQPSSEPPVPLQESLFGYSSLDSLVDVMHRAACLGFLSPGREPGKLSRLHRCLWFLHLSDR